MFEIEIKSLLGSSEKADALRKKMLALDAGTKLKTKNKQLNHYFMDGDIAALGREMKKHFSKEDASLLEKIATEGKNFSVRTRQLNDTVLLVIKASIDDTTSENGIARMEFEHEVSDMTLNELDQALLDLGFQYQAKWSREREEYVCKGANVCLDKNAGYGYLAEFEKIVGDAIKADIAKKELRTLMGLLEVEELAQDRLERMFNYYNNNWRDYYGTNKIFSIE